MNKRLIAPELAEVAVDIRQQRQPHRNEHDSNQTDDRDPQLADKTSPEIHLFRYLELVAYAPYCGDHRC